MTLKHVEHEKKTLDYKAKVHPITKSSYAPTHTSHYQSLVKKIGKKMIFEFRSGGRDMGVGARTPGGSKMVKFSFSILFAGMRFHEVSLIMKMLF